MLEASMMYENENGDIIAKNTINEAPSIIQNGDENLQYINAYPGINIDITIFPGMRRDGFHVIPNQNFISTIPEGSKYIFFEEYLLAEEIVAEQIDEKFFS